MGMVARACSCCPSTTLCVTELRMFPLGDRRQGSFDHVQALIELCVGHDQRDEDTHYVVKRPRSDGDQSMFVAIARNLFGFGIRRLAATRIANQFHAAHSAEPANVANHRPFLLPAAPAFFDPLPTPYPTYHHLPFPDRSH